MISRTAYTWEQRVRAYFTCKNNLITSRDITEPTANSALSSAHDLQPRTCSEQLYSQFVEHARRKPALTPIGSPSREAEATISLPPLLEPPLLEHLFRQQNHAYGLLLPTSSSSHATRGIESVVMREDLVLSMSRVSLAIGSHHASSTIIALTGQALCANLPIEHSLFMAVSLFDTLMSADRDRFEKHNRMLSEVQSMMQGQNKLVLRGRAILSEWRRSSKLDGVVDAESWMATDKVHISTDDLPKLARALFTVGGFMALPGIRMSFFKERAAKAKH